MTDVAGEASARPDVEAALARILESDAFTRSRRNSELLDYLVRNTLAGQSGTLNGTTIAQDVFGKGAEFDPASDPSVRVQMGRLRKMLVDYYEGIGSAETLRIDVPKGSYVPVFKLEPASAAAQPSSADLQPTAAPAAVGTADADPDDARESVDDPRIRARRLGRRWWRPAAAALVVGLLVTFALQRSGVWPFHADEPELGAFVNQFPVVVVREFENRTDDPVNDMTARGLRRQFAADLQRFRIARVALDEPPPVVGIPGVRARADFIVTGALLESDPTLDVLVWLIDANDASIAVTERLRLDVGASYYEALDTFSKRLSAQFAAPRGQISRATLQSFENLTSETASDLGAFRCLSLFSEFRVVRNEQAYPGVYDCLSAEAERLPDNGAVLAALSWMTMLGSPEAGLLPALPEEYQHTPAEAVEIARNAVSVDPANDDAHVYLGLIQWFLGNSREGVESLRRALQLNPANPEHRADYALRLALMGQWPEARRLANQALGWSLNPPGWYQLPLFLEAVTKGDGLKARALVELGVSRHDPFQSVYDLVAAAMVEDQTRIDRLLPEVMASDAAQRGDALLYLRRWLQSPEILGTFEQYLRPLGVPLGNDAI